MHGKTVKERTINIFKINDIYWNGNKINWNWRKICCVRRVAQRCVSWQPIRHSGAGGNEEERKQRGPLWGSQNWLPLPMQHEGNSIHHRLSKLPLKCLFPSSFLSRFFPLIFSPHVSGLYFSSTSYLLYLPSLFYIFFLSRFHFLNYHYLSLLFLFLFFMLIIPFITTFISLQSFHLLPFSSISFTSLIYLTHFHFAIYLTFFVFIFFFLSSSPFHSV
jgi:hypothetical protein